MKPLVRSLIEDERVGEKEGGLGYAEVELDSVLIGDLGVKFMVCVFCLVFDALFGFGKMMVRGSRSY